CVHLGSAATITGRHPVAAKPSCYIPSASSCNEATLDPDMGRSATGSIPGGVAKYLERAESDIIVVDPFTGEVKKRIRKPYPNRSAALTTAGGLLFTGLVDGSFSGLR